MEAERVRKLTYKNKTIRVGWVTVGRYKPNKKQRRKMEAKVRCRVFPVFRVS